jgi:hypothetical protein
MAQVKFCMDQTVNPKGGAANNGSAMLRPGERLMMLGVKVPPSMKECLTVVARERGVSVSDVVRELVADHFGLGGAG